MAPWTVATHLFTAVKNGPITLWGPFQHPGPFTAFGRLITSWPWLLGITCAYIALAAGAYEHGRGTRGPLGKAATAATAALGLTVALELLTQNTALAWLVLTGLIAVCINAILRVATLLRRPPGHTAEVVDLRRWREHTLEHRRSGRR
jgi:hypothetical protein